jgi:hypothetical protein
MADPHYPYRVNPITRFGRTTGTTGQHRGYSFSVRGGAGEHGDRCGDVGVLAGIPTASASPRRSPSDFWMWTAR